MTENSTIKSAIDLIMDGEHTQATQKWLHARNAKDKCVPCFYSPLNKNVRCAACLETHLGMAALKRAYPSINHERLVAAQRSLDHWIRARS